MKFQRFTCCDITEKDIGRLLITNESDSYHWKRIMNDPDCESHSIVENIFEKVRLEEFSQSPARRNCLFLFDLKLDPDFYAPSMNFLQRQLNLVEVEVMDSTPNIARVNKSLITCRIEFGKLKADESEIIADAREYWSGVTETNLNEEILFLGRYRYTRIICQPELHFRPFLRELDAESVNDI